MDKLRIYVAATWASKNGSAKQAKNVLEQAGFVVTSRWIDLDIEVNAVFDKKRACLEACNDLVDISEADAIVLLNTQPRGAETSGKAVEWGYAYAMDKEMILVGEPTSVFHYLPDVIIVNGISEAIDVLRTLERGL